MSQFSTACARTDRRPFPGSTLSRRKSIKTTLFSNTILVMILPRTPTPALITRRSACNAATNKRINGRVINQRSKNTDDAVARAARFMSAAKSEQGANRIIKVNEKLDNCKQQARTNLHSQNASSSENDEV